LYIGESVCGTALQLFEDQRDVAAVSMRRAVRGGEGVLSVCVLVVAYSGFGVWQLHVHGDGVLEGSSIGTSMYPSGTLKSIVLLLVCCGRACVISFAGVWESSSDIDSTIAGSKDRELRFEGSGFGFRVTVSAASTSH
jgi:hypothetical protein